MTNNIPDTDLVRIAERDVIERAKELSRMLRTSPDVKGRIRLTENLLAAVALLESREQSAPKNVPESDSGPVVALSKTFTHGFDAPEAIYRIEKRGDSEPTMYWYSPLLIWSSFKEEATNYTEARRKEFLEKTLRGEPSGFPAGGIWVRVENKI